MKYIILVLSVIMFGCSARPKEYLYPEALVLFRPGMSSGEVETTYGKPQLIDKYAGEPSWTYMPKHLIEKGNPGDVEGFIIKFSGGKAVAIEKYTISIGRPY